MFCCNVGQRAAVLSSEDNERRTGMEAILIPIVAIIISIGGPIALVIVIITLKHREDLARYDTIRRAVEAGRPAEEVERMLKASGGGSTPNPNKSLRTGIILIGIGIGTGLTGFFIGNTSTYAGMAFLCALGAAFILVWHFVDRRKGSGVQG
jgi:hypothetical protein